jgi:tRNA (guanine-N7-)-methyltransferase
MPGGAQPAASLLYRPMSFFEPLHLPELYGSDQPLEVELGSGDGTFLVEYAPAHPEHNFLGVERLLGRIRKIDRKGRRAGLVNLRALRIEAGYFLEYLLPKESICALHVYFPDPWPKRRHLKNRLVNERFPELAQRVLQPHGRVYLRTDNADYFAQMTRVFGASRAFKTVETPAELASLFTDFEREFQAKGVATLRAAYELSRNDSD